MMKQTNIVPSSGTATFSARRRSHRPMVARLSSPICTPRYRAALNRRSHTLRRALIHRVDALERALGPVVAVFLDVFLLGEGAEGGQIGLVDLLALRLEEGDDFLFLRIEFRRAVV